MELDQSRWSGDPELTIVARALSHGSPTGFRQGRAVFGDIPGVGTQLGDLQRETRLLRSVLWDGGGAFSCLLPSASLEATAIITK